MFLIKLLFLVLSLKTFAPEIHLPIPTPTSPPAGRPLIQLLPNGKPPQLVILSFDGSQSLEMWKSTLEYSAAQKKSGTRIPFTYFVSGVYFVPLENRFIYQAPHQIAGDSKIGFGLDETEVNTRLQYIRQALAAGHEIGSHLNGHFDSSNWSVSDWDSEFVQFGQFTKLVNIKFAGFRAPNLAWNNSLWPVMQKHGFVYEAGQVGSQDDWPKKIDGVWRIYLPSVHLLGTNLYPLAMDYNFYVTQTNAVDKYRQGTPVWTAARDQVVNSFIKYFHHNYSGNRAPVVFSAHFADWNDGLYWSAMQVFSSQVCSYPETQCVTYKELINYLDGLQPV